MSLSSEGDMCPFHSPTVVSPDALGASMFSKILVPLDNSPLSDRVLKAALKVAEPTSQILVLRLEQQAASLTNSEECRTDLNIIEAETNKLTERIYHSTKTLVERPHILIEVRTGPLVQTVLDTCEEFEATLIVMGTHGRKGLAQQITGSITEQVVSKAAASVFVVKAEGYPFLQD